MRFRLLLLILGTLAAGRVLVALVREALVGPMEAVPAGTGSLEDALLAVCALGLGVAGLVWCWGLLLALAEASGGALARWAAALPCPALVRALALGCLGASLVVGPAASADPPHDVSGVAPGAPGARTVSGLPLPERMVTPAVAPSPGARVVVAPGDTLWALAAQVLPPGSSDATVDRAWRRIATANPQVAAHPHLIFPGTVLRVPPLHDLHRKDQP